LNGKQVMTVGSLTQTGWEVVAGQQTNLILTGVGND